MMTTRVRSTGIFTGFALATVFGCAGASSPPLIAPLSLEATQTDTSPPSQNPPPKDDDKDADKKIKIKLGTGELEADYTLEIAADFLSRTKGLSGRKEIAERGGMIFVYTNADIRNFWMYECLVDIDILYLDPKGVVTATHTMKAEPLRQPRESAAAYEARLKRYTSRRPAQFAIELKAGEIKRLQIKPGDVIEFDRKKLTDLARRLAEEDGL